jgi:hypothetical protein
MAYLRVTPPASLFRDATRIKSVERFETDLSLAPYVSRPPEHEACITLRIPCVKAWNEYFNNLECWLRFACPRDVAASWRLSLRLSP